MDARNGLTHPANPAYPISRPDATPRAGTRACEQGPRAAGSNGVQAVVVIGVGTGA